MLLVVTCRPEFQPAWKPSVARVELRPLAAADAEALVRHIPGGEHLAQALTQGIVVRADGVPLFVEELTKAVVEASQLRQRAANRQPGAFRRFLPPCRPP